jgi:gliding motility-associated-like protein
MFFLKKLSCFSRSITLHFLLLLFLFSCTNVFSQPAVCDTWTYQVKIGNANATEKINDMVMLGSGESILVGEYIPAAALSSALLVKINEQGIIVWNKLLSVPGLGATIIKAKLFSDNKIYVIGHRISGGTGITVPFLACFDLAGALQWIRQVGSPAWQAVDLSGWDETINNSFCFLLKNNSSLNVCRISLDGNTVIWNRTITTALPPSPIGICGSYDGAYIAYNETEGGFDKVGMIYLDINDGHIKESTMAGGPADGNSYRINSMKMINLRPRITAIRTDPQGALSVTKMNYDPGGAPYAQEAFNIAGINPTLSTFSDHDNWSEVLLTADNSNARQLFMTFTFPDNYQTPISSRRIMLPEDAQISRINKTNDNGSLIVSNTVSGDIILTKTDSIGTLPTCGSVSTSSSFISNPTPHVAITLASGNNVLSVGTMPFLFTDNISDAVTHCRETFCPVVPEPDPCLRTFFKEYRSKSNTLLFRSIEKTADQNLLVTGFTRENPYVATDTYNFTVFDTTGKIIITKNVSYPVTTGVNKTILLRDNNFLAAGYIYHDFYSIDLIVFKFDRQLNMLWCKLLTSTSGGNAAFHDIRESAEGDIYCYLENGVSATEERRFLLKLNGNGTPLWFKKYSAGPNVFPGSNENSGLITELGDHVYLKYVEENSDRSPHIIKINKSDGNTVWTKKYRIDNNDRVETWSFLPKANNLYLFTGDENPMALKLNPDGDVLHKARFNYLQQGPYSVKSKDPGKFIMHAALIEGQQFSNGIIEFDTSFQVLRKSFIQLPKAGYLYDIAVMSDSVTYAPGTFFYENPYWASSNLQKYNFNGASGVCAVADFPMTTEPITVAVTTINTITTTIPLPAAPDVALGFTGATINYSNLHCSGNSPCEELKLTGPAAACDPSVIYEYTVERNPGCTGKVFWRMDTLNNQVEIIEQNDSRLRIKIKNTHQFRVYVNMFGGCEWLADTITTDVSVGNLSLDIGDDVSLCDGNTLVLHAQPGFVNYLWQDHSTGLNYTVDQPGTYFIEASDGCRIQYDTVIVTGAPPIKIDLGPDLVTCNADSVKITAPAGFVNYTWSNNYNITATSGQTVTVYPASDTMYTVKAEQSPGCFGYDSVRVHVNYSPPVNLGPDQGFCTGSSLFLDAGPGFDTYEWSTGQTTRQITVQQAGSYRITATDANGCKSYDTLIVQSVYPLPVVNLDKNPNLCAGDTRILQAGNGYAFYNWSSGSNASSLSINAPGTYWVEVTSDRGCKTSDTTRITKMLPLPNGFLPADTVLCSYLTMQLKPESSYRSYQWSTGYSASAITVSQPGTYWLEVTDNNNCKGKDTIAVTHKQCMEGFFIPSAFTPNQDGKNDIYRPSLFGTVVKYRFTIYNRWGEKIYETTQLQAGWNGKVAGIDTDTNVFVWTCSFQFAGQKEEMRKGSFTLIR